MLKSSYILVPKASRSSFFMFISENKFDFHPVCAEYLVELTPEMM